MSDVSQEQLKAIRAWFAAKKIKCPMCGAGADELQLNGTTRMSFLPWPDNSHAGGTSTMVHVECTQCANVILIDCQRAKIPFYK